MSNPLLALQVQPPDIAGNFLRGQQQAGEMQTARLGNILANYKLKQAQAADQRANSLAMLYQQHGAGLAKGNEADVNALAAVDPEAALNVRSKTTEIAKNQYDVDSKKADRVAGLFGTVLDAPDEAKPLVFQWVRNQAEKEGFDVSKMPEQYSPELIPLLKSGQQAALSVKDQFAARHQQSLLDETTKADRNRERLTARGQDMADARARETNGGVAKAPAGYRFGADGKTLEFIPGGPADPSKGAGKKAPTEDQAKNNQLYTRAKAQLPIVLENFDALGSFGNLVGSKVPGTTALTSEKYQRADGALRDIAATYLYSVSGATANAGEVENLMHTVRPILGDSEQARADKKARLAQMVDSIKMRATPTSAGNEPSVLRYDADGNLIPEGQ